MSAVYKSGQPVLLKTLDNPEGVWAELVSVEPPLNQKLNIVGRSAGGSAIVLMHGEQWTLGQLVLWNGNGFRVQCLDDWVNGKRAFVIVSALDLKRKITPPQVLCVPVADLRVIEEAGSLC